jgi:L-ascorbate metabolism protein UlaG (beta-lactamase superfamily)
MKIGGMNIGFVTHTSFLFGSAGGAVILTEPYFLGGYVNPPPKRQGQNLTHIFRRELHLQRPDVQPEYVTQCDAIFISHIHTDHCDLEATRLIVNRTEARVFAAPDILDQLAALGTPVERLVEATDGGVLAVKDLRLTALGGYDDSFDEKGRMNKFSLLVEDGGTTLWQSGDCHNLPPALNGNALDAVFCWTIPNTLERIAGLNPPPERFVVMHCDQHEPGQFWCKLNPEQQAEVVRAALPDSVEVIVPDRLGAFSSFRDALEV